jgi:RNA polymerase sigma factor (sigma-70 family)
MYHRTNAFTEALDAERDIAARRRFAPDAGDLERLMLSAAHCDNDAWASLIRRFAPGLRRLAQRQGLNASDAEDVVQTTWLELLLHIGRLREPDRVAGWLHTTARRESVRIAIAARREPPCDELLNEPIAPDEAYERVSAAERSTALDAALRALPEHQRTLMQLLVCDAPPSYVDISAALNIPLGSIGPTRGRLLERLRRDPALIRAVGAEVG